MTQQPLYGPHNPHPLSQMRTELVWEGKYDEYGQRREVDIAGCAMPMQKIESIDEPRRAAAANNQLELFEQQNPKQDDFRNRLIWGDNKLVMASLLQEFKGKVDLIYIDPPFDVGADFTLNLMIGDGYEEIAKDQSTLEMVAYRDMWGRGTDSYLHLIYERISLIKELLSESGSTFVHCDYRVNGMLRLILDEVFGKDFFRNQISWCYAGGGAPRNYYQQKTDTIFWYSKSDKWIFNKQFRPYSEGTFRTGFKAKGMENSLNPEGAGLMDWWADCPKILSFNAAENMGYPTQKPESLIQRIILGHSNEGDLVADFFCGSGTTGAVAERLGRKWLMADLGRFAIHTSRKRLIELQRKLHSDGKPYRAFDVYNLGRYERQWWQQERLQGADTEHRRVILEFFKAEMLTNTPSPLLHGRKAGAFCHVDGIDSMFTREEAKQVAQATAQAGGRECYCLAWEFEMDLHLLVNALVQELGVKLKLIQIPREIMEKNRKAPPPFLEVAVLAAEPVYRKGDKGKTVDLKLTQFLPSLAEVPTKELDAIRERAIRSGFDFIDFWAIDFNWQPGKPFTHDWQDYRTRKDRSLKTISDAGYEYPAPGKYIACVKVVDTFGCDTSITVEVEV